MKRTCAAEGHEAELAHVIALFHGNNADGAHHIGVHDGNDAICSFVHAQMRFSAQMRLNGGFGLVQIDIHPAAENFLLVELAEINVCIGDGRKLAAAAVAGRARRCAGGFRADLHHAAGVDFRNGAAACADGNDVDHRDSGRVALNQALVGDLGFVVFNQADIGGGAAHVEGDDLICAALPADICRGNDARGRAGDRRFDRALDGFLDGDDRTV